MYLFILESIGTSELLLIALIALIVFGPRKLPQMAKTVGKTINEFKRAGHEFRSTWEREVTLEESEKVFLKDPLGENPVLAEIKYSETVTITENKILAPEVREISQADFSDLAAANEIPSSGVNETTVKETVKTETAAATTTSATDSSTNKHDWL
ncbi:MAG TPA: twin-arginine translocase TatA/TatE family subunit [Pyrinomonadaceae bacterium]|nr:twin-arginine translocase TatA/TatE family subunit [Pyrinomonadaceae bacterium]